MQVSKSLAATVRATSRTWLVTGAAGFIGSHLVETLLQLDQRVVGLDNLSTGTQENLNRALAGAGPGSEARFRFIHGDIRSPMVCREACENVAVVLHQAGMGSVPRSLAEPTKVHGINVDGFVHMLLAARDCGAARFVYASSSAVYGDTTQLPMREAAIGNALSPYALTKRIDELYADVFARCYGVQAIGLRYFNVFGPRQNPQGHYAAVIPKWIWALLNDEPVHIHGDGSTARDFCFVGNVVEANLRAAIVTEPEAIGQVYNVALGARTTLSELFEMLRMLLAAHRPDIGLRRAEHRARRLGDIHCSEADIGKARRLLGYQPEWEVREGLKWTIDWYLRNGTDVPVAAEAPAAPAIHADAPLAGVAS